LLGFYLELYDRVLPHMRTRVEEFYRSIAALFERAGVDVVAPDVCRVKGEFEKAADMAGREGADALVVLFLAYSPSLESADTLVRSDLPLIILDTTPKYGFDHGILPDDILYNHGIHGVQDICSILKRHDRRFILETGHWKESDVIERVIKHVKGAFILSSLKHSRSGIIGSPFAGMGDFFVPFDILKQKLGVEVVKADAGEIARYMPDENDASVKTEMDRDRKLFHIRKLDTRAHINNTRIGLAVRKWIEEEGLTAFTMNFSEIGPDSGFPSLPFLEAGKAMARGIGYAGEGDVFTASVVGALMGFFPQTTFTEMFCPDWKGERIFLSHMGEVNVSLIEGRPRLVEKELAFIDVGNPVLATGGLKKGKALYVNLTPGKDYSFTLILSEVKMEKAGKLKNIDDTIYGWLVPQEPLRKFLYDFSMAGGTHHSALVYDGDMEILESLGQAAGWDIKII